MKSRIFFLIILCQFGLALAQNASAVIRLDNQVALPATELGVPLRAYRINGSCRNWNFVPGRLVASNNLIHHTGLASNSYGDQKLLAYVSTLQMTASPAVTDVDMDRLRSAILAYLNDLPECKGQVKSTAEISLSSLPVQVAFTYNPIASSGSSAFGAMMPTYATPDGSYFDAMNPSSISYVTDASSAEAVKNLRTLQEDSQRAPKMIGTVTYMLDGIVAEVNSTLSMDGEMAAKFVSAISLLHCSVSKKSAGFNGDIGTAIAGKLAGVDGVGFHSESTTCEYGLLPAAYMGGSLESNVGISHKNSRLQYWDPTAKKYKDIMVTPCNSNGECGDPVTLEQYLNFQLIKEILLTNFEFQIKTATDKTYEGTLGKNGQAKTTFSAKASYQRNFEERIGVSIPVYAWKIDSSVMDFGFTNTPFYQCLVDNYYSQSEAFANFVGLQPVPAAKDCLKK